MLTTQEAKNVEFAQARLNNLVKSVLSRQVITLVVETVSLCNLKCNFCDAHSGRAPEYKQNAGIMNDKTWQSFITSLKDYVLHHGPIHMIQFYGNGEPLLDNNLEQKISYLKSAKLTKNTRIISNGTLLSESRVRSLAEAGLDELHVSLDIIDRETYKKVKGLDAAVKVINNVKKAALVLEECKKTQLFIKYFKGGSSSDYGVSDTDGESVEKYFKDIAISSDFVHLKSQQLIDAGMGHLTGRTCFNQACEVPFYLLYLKHDGSVSACCTDVFRALEIGNINESSLQEIVNSKELASIRLSHILNKADQIPLCAGCGNRTAVDTSTLSPDVHDEIVKCLNSIIEEGVSTKV